MTYLDKHKRTLGILLVCYGILKVVLYFLGIQLLSVALSFLEDEAEVQFVAYILKYIIGFAVIFLTIPSILAGIGLMNEKRWGLILALIVGIISLPVFPIGTALGIYAIIVFLMDHSEAYNPTKPETPARDSKEMVQ